MRQEIVRSYAVTHPAGTVRLPQTPLWDQIVHAERGTVRLVTDAGSWTLPPDRAAWVAAGTAYVCTVAAGTVMRTLYVHSSAGPPLSTAQASVLDLGPLARQLLLRLVERAPLYDDDPAVAAWLTVLRGELATVDVAALRLPVPRQPDLRDLAERILVEVDADWSVQRMARLAGRSRRSLERRWRSSVGLSVAQWVTRARLQAALDLLAEGQPVGTVARRVGYATPSAFGAMFRRQLGVSPRAYMSHRS